MSVNIRTKFSENFKHNPKKLMGILHQSAKLRSQMFSGPPGNLFSIFMNVVFTSSFLHLCYNMCILLYRVYEKSGKINKTRKNPKNPIKPIKTQPLPYKRSDWDRVFLGYTPPNILLVKSFELFNTFSYTTVD